RTFTGPFCAAIIHFKLLFRIVSLYISNFLTHNVNANAEDVGSGLGIVLRTGLMMSGLGWARD
ncbi:hypothetical protein, partial [Salmonella sp. gx-f7]|uniref:hypothetical protein n=1 Tax=Salmonella sp. gx-f7 TaxID=2582606 RepID=UPI001F3A4A1D